MRYKPVIHYTTVALLTVIAATAEGSVKKVITAVPYSIQQPGNYVLGSSLKYSGTGAAITILTDNVTIDLRGKTIGADREISKINETAGIFAHSRTNITIRNGTIEGFFRGIYLEGSKSTGGHLVEKIEAKDCTFLGIQVKGNRSIVRDCFVNVVGRDGGATSYTAIRYGMDLIGDGFTVRNNLLVNVMVHPSGSTAYGIRLVNSDSAVVEGNRLVNTTDAFSLVTRGLLLNNSSWSIVASNIVTGYAAGIEFSSSSGGQSSLYRDNTVTRAFSQYIAPGGTASDGGGNK